MIRARTERRPVQSVPTSLLSVVQRSPSEDSKMNNLKKIYRRYIVKSQINIC